MIEHCCTTLDRKKYHRTIVHDADVTVTITDPETKTKEIITFLTYLKFPSKESRIAYQIDKLPKCSCGTFSANYKKEAPSGEVNIAQIKYRTICP